MTGLLEICIQAFEIYGYITGLLSMYFDPD